MYNVGCTPTKTLVASARAAHVAMRDELLEAVLWFFVDPQTEGLRANYSRGLFECGQNVLYIASALGRPPLGAADEVQALY